MSTTSAPRRVAVVLGTRPEAVKLAPVVVALRDDPRYEPVVVATGQHRDLVTPILDLFDARADVELDLMVPGQGLAALTARALAATAAALDDVAADAVLVQGDTTTTLAGAMAGFYSGRPVAHLEAGLRTGDRFSPFPEEVNRRQVTQLADLHLAPTARARDALLAEGVDPASVALVGNTVVDALLATVRRGLPYAADSAAELSRLHWSGARVVLVTAHRRESWDGGTAAVARAVAQVVREHRDVHVVWPLHPNPVVREAVLPHLVGLDRVLLTDPLGYADLVRLLARADVVLTDSGGLQEEACSLGKPTLVTRDVTERPEGLEAGGLRLVGTATDRVRHELDRLLVDPAAYEALVCRSMPFGDGTAARQSVDALARVLDPRAPALLGAS